MSELKKHWNSIYAQKRDDEVAWFQLIPSTSLRLIQKYSNAASDNIIDIGGGNSNLTKLLCQKGFKNFSVLDISEEAIERCRAKLSKCKGIHDLFVDNVLDFSPRKQYHIWHDRAVFHFFTQNHQIDNYVKKASEGILLDGYLILSTFASNGPESCSGLKVKRYHIKQLQTLFSSGFELVESFAEVHQTPFNTEQDSVWLVFRKIRKK